MVKQITIQIVILFQHVRFDFFASQQTISEVTKRFYIFSKHKTHCSMSSKTFCSGLEGLFYQPRHTILEECNQSALNERL